MILLSQIFHIFRNLKMIFTIKFIVIEDRYPKRTIFSHSYSCHYLHLPWENKTWLSLTHTITLSLSRLLSKTHTLSLSFSFPNTHFFYLSLSLFLSFPNTNPLSHYLSLTTSQLLTHSLYRIYSHKLKALSSPNTHFLSLSSTLSHFFVVLLNHKFLTPQVHQRLDKAWL